MRGSENLRRLIRETNVSVGDLIMPFFVREGKGVRKPIASLPGISQFSVDTLIKEVRAARSLGIPAVLLFGIPGVKDEAGSGAYARDGIVQKAVAAIKERVSGIAVVTDVCLCEFTSHGHCGVIKKVTRSPGHQVTIDNEATLELLARTALSHARAGADMVAPSAMADGQVRAIRAALDDNDFSGVPVMAYSAKYASAFYGPFRQAAGSAPQFGDRRSYQMDPANAREALREVALDVQEGADIIMVKPALAYLDVIATIRERFDLPLAAYNVSGEFAMVKAAARQGMLDEERAALEVLAAIKRAGADIIITYHAMELARLLA
jgi:porphobilinogen synthase